MKVSLINYTPNPDKVATLAAKTCYSEKSISDIQLTEETIKTVLPKVIKSGHLSTLEHISFTFGIEGISRVATHQLVRHRLASYSQQSHRYTKIKNNSFIVPQSIQSNQQALDKYNKLIQQALDVYNELIGLGVKKEDARFVIPQAVSSNLVMTMNARELLHFFKLRCCVRAQWEIRELANQMLKLVKPLAPVIFENAGPSCVSGKCPEEKPCKNIKEIREYYRNL